MVMVRVRKALLFCVSESQINYPQSCRKADSSRAIGFYMESWSLPGSCGEGFHRKSLIVYY